MGVLKTFLAGFVCIAVICAIGAGVLIHAGFRANATPSRAEATLARSLRDLSIPRSESSLRNPFGTDSDAVRQGHDYFLSRCTVCHGFDGSAKTPVGVNLYPRAPDLRTRATQDLTDGEIHFIIENGVRFTGMPALEAGHTAPSDDSWKLVSFIRSLGENTKAEETQGQSTSAHYVGSKSCEKCHASIYQGWQKTPMANVVRDPRDHPDAVIPDLATNTVAKFTKDQVAFVYGNLWKQRYFTKIGDDYFPLPAQWAVGAREWRPYKVPAIGGDWWAAFYPDDNMKRPTGPTCDGCHSVGYDIRTKQVAEWNVGCERCHGPGSEHVEHPGRWNITNPTHMDSFSATDTCIQCHSQGQPLSKPIEGKYNDWPVGYNVGLRLADFWTLEDCALGQTSFLYFPDCTAHKNRMQGNDFVQSVMYRRGVTCFSCHDVHGTSNYAQLRKPADQLCLDCHGPSSANGPHTATLAEHTHHKEGSAGSQCVACHMPQIQTEGVPGALVHAHTFRFISPAEADKYKIPNPCTSCHHDRSNAWATDNLRRWATQSPWTPLI
jgi:predicted CXXCH cytochrome family protein